MITKCNVITIHSYMHACLMAILYSRGTCTYCNTLHSIYNMYNLYTFIVYTNINNYMQNCVVVNNN